MDDRVNSRKLYGDGARMLQDTFDSRRLADTRGEARRRPERRHRFGVEGIGQSAGPGGGDGYSNQEKTGQKSHGQKFSLGGGN